MHCLAQLAVKIQRRPGTLEGQKTVLKNIAFAANMYKKFLEGEEHVVAKNLVNLGNRHTLARGSQGHVYEMTNSMTSNEIARFKRKTGMFMDAVENSNRKYRQNGNIFTKIELGKGAFGKTRIARDIEADRYVAVKKIHPTLTISPENGFINQKPEPSNFYDLDTITKEKLKKISDFVVTPDDELMAESKTSKNIKNLANELAKWRPSSGEEVISIIEKLPDIKAKLLNFSEEELGRFIENLIKGKFANHDNDSPTAYFFSELGVTNIDNFIDNLNVLRTSFESNDTFDKLDAKSREIVLNYSKTFYIPSSDINQPSKISEFHKNKAIQIYNEDRFKLKDPVYNQRFLNTLGKKMLTSLAQLNNCEITHHDIKPDNIVLVQDEERNVSVKLIDIDLLQKNKNGRKKPTQGCIPFMPPEALFNERDGSVSYVGVKGDAYAMGLTLRRVIGFGLKEIIATSQIQKLKVAINSDIDSKLSEADEKKLADSINAMHLSKDTNVQNQLHVKAIISAAPQAVSLKDISDLMLKEHPGKRCTAEEVITDFSFFNDDDNILSDREFSNHTLRICRYGLLVNQEDHNRINNSREESENPLAQLRKNANSSMIRARHQVPDGNSGSSLSRREAEKVALVETRLQARAGLRRLGKSMSDLLNNRTDIADQKLQYKKR